MAELVFEIWRDGDALSSGCSQVSQHHDEIREKTSNNPVLVHTFTASSVFDAAQKHYDWQGWGKWKPPKGIDDIEFTDEEAEEQRKYLSVRKKQDKSPERKGRN